MILKTRRPFLVALVALLLAAYAWTGWTASLGKGPAFDESAHLVAGYSYWKFNDYRFQPENGNLPQRWAGLAVLPLGPRLNPEAAHAAWSEADVWRVGQRALFQSGNEPETLLAAGRGAMVLWGVALGLLVFLWSRRLWGAAGALLSLSLCAGSATMLAHGPIVTSDMVAAFCLLAASGAFWQHLRGTRPAWFVASLTLTGLAAIAKFSVLVLPLVYGLLFLLHQLCPPEGPAPPRSRRHLAKGAALLAGLSIAHVAAGALFVWAAFGFRYQAEAPGLPTLPDLYIPWNELLPDSGPRRAVLVALKEHRLLPEAYTHGLAFVLRASEARGAFAAGTWSETGWWWFFPYAFLLKSTLAELAATFALGLWCVARGLRRGAGDLGRVSLRIAPLLVFAAVYGVVSLTSNLNIGHRHILPLYPVLFILAGGLLHRSAAQNKAVRALALALVLGQAATAIRAHGHYLAFFNPFAGPADQRWRQLVDSSLDWGQELPALGDWLRVNRRADEELYLGYFGVGDPRYEGIDARSFGSFVHLWTRPRLARLEPGLYCVGATVLQDVYSPFAGEWTPEKETGFRSMAAHFETHPEAWAGEAREDGTPEEMRRWIFERLRFARLAQYLRLRQPEAVIGHSILVYRLDARETSIAIDLDLSGLVTLLEEALEARDKDLKAAP